MTPNQPEKKFVSKCCNANYSVLNRARSIIAADLLKVCGKCGQECDAIEVQPEVPEWEKEFDEKCPATAYLLPIEYRGFLVEKGQTGVFFDVENSRREKEAFALHENIKDFIRSLRNQTLEEAAEALEKGKPERPTRSIMDLVTALRKEEGMTELEKMDVRTKDNGFFIENVEYVIKHREISSAQSTLRSLKS